MEEKKVFLRKFYIKDLNKKSNFQIVSNRVSKNGVISDLLSFAFFCSVVVER